MIVEPAQTDTDMWRTADGLVDVAEAEMGDDHRTPAHRRLQEDHPAIAVDGRGAGEKVSAVVEHALTAGRPRASYVVGIGPRLVAALMANLPPGLRDRILRKAAGQP